MRRKHLDVGGAHDLAGQLGSELGQSGRPTVNGQVLSTGPLLDDDKSILAFVQRVKFATRLSVDEWYGRLVATIREETGVSQTEAAEMAQWSREYIAQVRAGTAGNTPPKNRRRKVS